MSFFKLTNNLRFLPRTIQSKTVIGQCSRLSSSKVPDGSSPRYSLREVWRLSSRSRSSSSWNLSDPESLPEVPGIDLALVEQLERVSLVELNNEEGLRLLQSAVKSAMQLQQVDTEGVEPLASVMDDRELWLRSDEVTEGNCAQEILQNAAITDEQYFVAPPGNIPLKKKSKEHLSKLLATGTDNTS